MRITKDGIIAKVFSELPKRSLTSGIDATATSIRLVPNKGIYLKYSNGQIFIKDKGVDISRCVAPEFVPAVNAALEESENQYVDVSAVGGNIAVGKFLIETSDPDDFDVESQYDGTDSVTFTEEQFRKLEGDFKITIGNYMRNPYLVDVICFSINQGELYKTVPFPFLYKIERFDATIDDVKLQQLFGHSVEIFTFPRKMFDILKNNGQVKVRFTSNTSRYMISTNDVEILLRVPEIGKTTFTSFVTNKMSDKTGGIDIGFLHDLILPGIDSFMRNYYDCVDDPKIMVRSTGSLVELTIGQMKIKYTTERIPEFCFETNLPAFIYALKTSGEGELLMRLYDDSDITKIRLVHGDSVILMPNTNG